MNNISPTVNVLIHSEEKNLPKKKKSINQKRINSININPNYNTITNKNGIKNTNQKTKKFFNGIINNI